VLQHDNTPIPSEVGPGETTTIQNFPGNLTLANQSTLVVNIGAGTTVVVGTLTIVPGSMLVINNVGMPGDITVVQANGGIQGTFATVQATASDPCLTATVGQTSYQPQTLTVAVSLADSGQCATAGTLSGGAIAGIVIGSVVGVAIIVVAIVGAGLHRRKTEQSLSNI
jgi:hypothetical protein